MSNKHYKKHSQKALKVIGDYTLTQNILGKGQFGEVVLAQYTGSGKVKNPSINEKEQFLACKIIQKANLTQRLQVNLKSEIGILSKVSSPHVIGLYDI